MKKVIALVCVLALAVCSVFASVELTVSASYVPSLTFDCNKLTDTLQGDVTSSVGGGLDLTWYLLYAGTYDVGFNADASLIFGNSLTTTYHGTSTTDNMTTHTLTGKFGPAIRFNLNEKNCLTFEPGLRKIFTGGSVNDTRDYFNRTSFSASGTIIDVEIGYRNWFVNSEKFHMGLAVSANFGKPLNGTFMYYSPSVFDDTFNIQKGFTQRYTVGLAFNFGKTAADHAKVIEEPATVETVGTPSFDRSELFGTWNTFEDRNKKAVGYFVFNEDGTGYFKYVPDGKNTVVDSAINWQLTEKGGKTFMRISNCKLNDVNKEWECTLDDGILTFKKQVCFGLYPNNKWIQE